MVAGKIYLLNMGNLYSFDLEFKMVDLPYQIGDVHRIVVSRNSDIYMVSTKGLVKGFNPVDKRCFTPVPINLHSLI